MRVPFPTPLPEPVQSHSVKTFLAHKVWPSFSNRAVMDGYLTSPAFQVLHHTSQNIFRGCYHFKLQRVALDIVETNKMFTEAAESCEGKD